MEHNEQPASDPAPPFLPKKSKYVKQQKIPGLTHERHITEIMACTFGYTV